MPAIPPESEGLALSLADPAGTSSHQSRPPRLLWANAYCLLDTSSGASMSVREMLHQLHARGWQIEILGATVFDSERGTVRFGDRLKKMHDQPTAVLNVQDGPLRHRLIKTASTRRPQMQVMEENLWFGAYQQLLGSFRPDLVWFYGGQPMDLLIGQEARARGIPSAAYLANANYNGARWCRDVDLVLTDTHATAGLYRDRLGIQAVPIGKFIDPRTVVASEHQRERLLFINPSLAKGAAVVVQLAGLLEQRRPEIPIEVVESRGDWHALVRSVSAAMGRPRERLENVTVTPHTSDMRPIYGRARLLLAPSLWWESGARVLAEAMLNGIPAIVSQRGGSPEMIGPAGIKVAFPEHCHQAPYTKMPPLKMLLPLVERIEQLYDDEVAYRQLVDAAFEVGRQRHGLAVSSQRLMTALSPLATRRAGDEDQMARLRVLHRHGVAESRQPQQDERRG